MIDIRKNNINVREFTKDDFPQFLTELCRNPKWNNVFQMWNVNDDEAVKLFTHHLDEYKEYNIKDLGLMLGIFTKENTLIGECGFEYNPELNSVEVFLGIVEDVRGNGYSHEIVDSLCDIANNLEINTIHANVPEAHNVAIKVFDKSKFELINEYDLEINNELTMKMKHYIYNRK